MPVVYIILIALAWWLCGVVGCVLIIYTDGIFLKEDVPLALLGTCLGPAMWPVAISHYFVQKAPNIIWVKKEKIKL